MKSEKRMVYWCDYCNKRYLSKGWCERHEKRCDKNPENNRACFNCIHLEMDNDAKVYWDDFRGMEHEQTVNAYYCKKLEKYLIPPKAEHKGNAYEFGNALNEPMPKECEHQNEYEDLTDIDFSILK